MNIKEMHIEVSQSTQNIAANVRRKLQPEEIDWLLNKSQQRFIQGKVKPKEDGSGGFQVDQMDTDAIRTLMKTQVLPVHYEAGQYSALLPADYSYLLSDESFITQQCTPTSLTAATVNEDVLQLVLSTTSKADPLYYASVALTVGAVTFSLQEVSDFFGGTYTGVKSKAEVFLPVDALLWYMRNVKNINVYWERYRGIFKPKTFLFPGVSTGQISVDGVVKVGGAVTSSYKTFAGELPGVQWVPNRLMASSKLSTMKVTPFYQTDYRSPLSEISDQYVVVYGDERFIVSKVRVDYIKKPRRMSLILGQDSELPEDFRQAICDLAVEYFKGMTADPNWEVKLRDNMLRSVPNQ
jgi:hypothetical protein